MSKPGYPISMDLATTVSNSFTPWNSPTIPGTDPLHHWKVRFEDKDGANTPGWPNAIQTNSYLRSVFTWNNDPLDVEGTIDHGSGHVDTFTGSWGDTFGVNWIPWVEQGNPFSLGDEVSQIRERLIAKLIDKIQSHRVNLGEVLQTRAQTANMVASSLNRVAGAFLALRRGNFVGAARYLTGADPRTRTRIRTSKSGRVTSGFGGIPEQWLALKYGWQPALQDIYNGCEAVRKAWNDDGELFTVDASAKTQGDKIILERSSPQPHGPTFVAESTEREVRGNASVSYRVDSSLTASLSQLGVTNPASLAWELLPLSFVVDWAYPVGSFLERLDYARGLVFDHGWISIKAQQDVKQRLGNSVGTSGDIVANWSGGKGSGSAMVFTREALSSFPSPPPPRLKDPFSLTHVANGLALLATAFRGGKLPR